MDDKYSYADIYIFHWKKTTTTGGKKCKDYTVKLRSKQTELHSKGTNAVPDKHICYKFSQKETAACRENTMAGTEIVFRNQKQCNVYCLSLPLHKQLHQNDSRSESQNERVFIHRMNKPRRYGQHMTLVSFLSLELSSTEIYRHTGEAERPRWPALSSRNIC